MMRTAIGRLRAIGWIEGVSFLLLLGIAMPLKYVAGRPEAVRIVGLIHGMLFIGLCLAIADACKQRRWPLKRAAWVLGAALIPFGPFLIDGRLKREQDGG